MILVLAATVGRTNGEANLLAVFPCPPLLLRALSRRAAVTRSILTLRALYLVPSPW